MRTGRREQRKGKGKKILLQDLSNNGIFVHICDDSQAGKMDLGGIDPQESGQK
jgi:hypothetical protein